MFKKKQKDKLNMTDKKQKEAREKMKLFNDCCEVFGVARAVELFFNFNSFRIACDYGRCTFIATKKINDKIVEKRKFFSLLLSNDNYNEVYEVILEIMKEFKEMEKLAEQLKKIGVIDLGKMAEEALQETLGEMSDEEIKENHRGLGLGDKIFKIHEPDISKIKMPFNGTEEPSDYFLIEYIYVQEFDGGEEEFKKIADKIVDVNAKIGVKVRFKKWNSLERNFSEYEKI